MQKQPHNAWVNFSLSGQNESVHACAVCCLKGAVLVSTVNYREYWAFWVGICIFISFYFLPACHQILLPTYVHLYTYIYSRNYNSYTTSNKINRKECLLHIKFQSSCSGRRVPILKKNVSVKELPIAEWSDDGKFNFEVQPQNILMKNVKN